MMYGYGNDMTWWMVVYSVVWFVLIALAITAIVVWIRRNAVAAGGASGARHILDERFARSEIDDDEYRRRLTALSSQPSSGKK
jgi:putative membrane protein